MMQLSKDIRLEHVHDINQRANILVSAHELHEQVDELVQLCIAGRFKHTECGFAGAIVLDRAARS